MDYHFGYFLVPALVLSLGFAVLVTAFNLYAPYWRFLRMVTDIVEYTLAFTIGMVVFICLLLLCHRVGMVNDYLLEAGVMLTEAIGSASIMGGVIVSTLPLIDW